eukprot:TRINITY_DN2823_c0_g1_i3.p1 TRINITY_DN2823_c0_g1~~TRINITY_DN2823_c0_g1_i3.p1  ORF type:complete len:266 (-),score=27.61 TRINITY_DN2823_c0_g1_i3:30-827(-)
MRLWGYEVAIGTFLGLAIFLIFYKEEKKRYNYTDQETYAINYYSGDLSDYRKSAKYIFGLYVFQHPYFYALFFSFFSGVAAGLIILINGISAWNEYENSPNEKDFGPTILEIFSFINASSGLFTGFVSNWLMDKKIMRMSTYLIVSQTLSGVIFCILGTILYFKDSINIGVWFGILMALQGYIFGTTFFCLPALAGSIYGKDNFGTYFSWVSVSTALSAFVVPYFSDAMFETYHTNCYTFFTISAVILCAAISLTVLPNPKFKQI